MPFKRHEQYRFLARAHFWLLGSSLLAYLFFVFTFGPSFLSFDLHNKIRTLADELIVVTAVVLGPPATPVVTATPTCVAGSPRIVLDWADDAATTTWDIARESSPLATGLATSGYTDTAVLGGISYDYTVTALGPMSPGIATSTPIAATALDCSTLLPPASLTLTGLGKKNITPPRTLPIKLDESRPRVTGNTNIAHAIVDIILTRPTIAVRLTANANGYFSWKPPRSLKNGKHQLTVTITDPNDSSRTISETLEFFTKQVEVVQEENDQVVAIGEMFDFTLTLLTPGGLIRQGERLEFMLKPVRGLFPTGTIFEPSLINEQGETVFTAPTQTVTPEARPGLRWSLDTPVYLPAGRYTLQVEALMGTVSIGRMAMFQIEAKPFFRIGDRGVITYAEVAEVIGWILFALLGIFVCFFLFLLREYWLYLHSVRQVTERELRRSGLIPWRRGVSKL